MRADYHMHTAFSHDSESTAEEMILGAVEKGLAAICFTDHYDKDYIEWGAESVFDPEEYFHKLLPLKEKYRDTIKVRIGVELGLQPHLGRVYQELANAYPFDFIIGSVHAAGGLDPACGELFEGRSDGEVYRMVFEETLTDIRNISDFDVLGHIDYVVRYGENQARDYSCEVLADEIDAILKELILRGKGIELNMAGLKYGLPFAHPHPDILKRYCKLGGEIITVGADGHKPEHIAYEFNKADELLKSCGFKYYTEFEGRRPIFKQLP